MIKKAVIPAAGKGTRFLPATKEIPKEMIPLLDKPMINYVVDEVVGSGIETIVLVITEDKLNIKNYFSPNLKLEKFLAENGKDDLCKIIQAVGNMVKVEVVFQQEQLGLGHAVLCAEELIQNEPFAVILPDDLIFSPVPCLAQLMKVREQLSADSIIGVMEIPNEDTDKYGVIEGTKIDKKNYKIERMIEKPAPERAPSNLATPGRYIFSSEIFSCLKKIERGAGGEYQLTDAINMLAKSREVVAHIYDGTRHDIGQLPGYLEATLYCALRDERLKKRMDKYLENLGYSKKHT
jgi:UTP--glucose-1-phosphate uridylyltransferase